MGGIFISYRRGDTSPYAGRLSDTLTNRFGPDSIFRDIDGIAPGERFPMVIERAVESCDAMLALIGRRWMTVKDENRQRRLDDPEDYVRQEISAALRRDDVLVIPVLIEGATMPDADDLPEDLAPLAERNAVRISDAGWKDEVVHLIRALEKVVKDPKPTHKRAEAPPPAPHTQPHQPSPPYSPPAQPAHRPAPQPYQPAPATGPSAWQPRPAGLQPSAGGAGGGGGDGKAPVVPIAVAVGVLVIAVVAFLLIGGSGDDPSPADDAAIQLSQDSGPPGTQITVSGSGFDGGEMVRIRFHTTELAKVQADDDGSFRDLPVAIPNIGFDGQFDIVASGDRSSRFAREPFETGDSSGGFGPGPGPGFGFGDTAINLSQASGPPGTEITVSGSGFDADETVRVRLHTTEIGKVRTDADGSFEAAVVIPDIHFDGQFDIVATGERSIRFAREPFTIE